MILDQLLPAGERDAFLGETFLRTPYSRPGAAEKFCTLGTREQFLRLLESPGVDAMAARRGERWSEGRSPTSAEAETLLQEGYTVLIRGAERNGSGFAELARAFRDEFHAAVDVHLYCTPGQQHGFGWHYDAEDVFILQTHGTKTYDLRKNTVNPWPLAETMPADLRYERELMPMMRCELHAGDWLYIPNGYWHCARAETDSISIAVGVMMPAAIDLLTMIRPLLCESILWRQRLPIQHAGGEAANPPEDPGWLERLADDIRSTLLSERFLELLKERNARAGE